MPDISMCQNEDCLLRMKCYRFTATPSEYWQSYVTFTYDNMTGHCRGFWNNKQYKNITNL